MLYIAHESSFIDEGAKIGAGTHIWHFSHVCGGAEIGSSCTLGQNVFISNDVKIGNNVKVQNNVSIYDAITIEDDVFCGPSMVFTNVYNPRSHIVRKHEYRKTLVKKGATIGANATIICGVTINQYSFIAAGSVIKKDVKPYAMMAGVPAKQIGWVCECGVAIKFMENNKSKCEACGLEYILNNENCSRL
jgi:UDP-2-acetamido-3-amino-2,3-dideoxy-glucuronate N-acetyltransferase